MNMSELLSFDRWGARLSLMGAAILLGLLSIAAPAKAQGDPCALVGMFDAKAKRACQLALRPARSAPRAAPQIDPAGQETVSSPAPRAQANHEPIRQVAAPMRRRRPEKQYCTSETPMTDFDYACRDAGIRNYTKAIPEFRGLCDNGVAAACFELGDLFLHQNNSFIMYHPTAAELAEGPRLYLRACDMGNAFACAYAARGTERGENFKKDHAAALVLYQRSCDLGNSGVCAYGQGKGDYDCPDGRRERIIGDYLRETCIPIGNKARYVVPVRAERMQAALAEQKQEQTRLTTVASAAPLANDPKAPVSTAEENAVAANPYGFARLCQSGNNRACAVIHDVIDTYDMPLLILDNPRRWTGLDRSTLLATVHDLCAGKRPTINHQAYCEDEATLQYAIDKNTAADSKNPAFVCIAVEGTSTTEYYEYVNQNGTRVGGAPSVTRATGVHLHNGCRFAVDFKLNGSDGGVHTLGPNRDEHLPQTLMGSLINTNNISFKWIRRHQ